MCIVRTLLAIDHSMLHLVIKITMKGGQGSKVIRIEILLRIVEGLGLKSVESDRRIV